MKKLTLMFLLIFSLTEISFAQPFMVLDSAIQTDKGSFTIVKIQMAWTSFTQEDIKVRLEWGLYQDTNYKPIDFIYTDTTLTPEQINDFSIEVIPMHIPILYRKGRIRSGSGQAFSSKYFNDTNQITIQFDTSTTIGRLKKRLEELLQLKIYLLQELTKTEGAIIRISDFIKEEELQIFD